MTFDELNNIEGLQFIPVYENKRPAISKWQNSTEKHKLDKWGVGLVCGTPSGNLECLDIDCKYSLTGDLFESYKKMVHLADSKLLNKLVVQRTINGGYHLIYRCSKVSGNLKLANRPTTEEEKNDTYTKAYTDATIDGKDDVEAKKIAEKSKQNDKVKVLFETRGAGGQFVCHPTKGYEFIFGDLFSISEITPDERDILHGIARQFNEVVEEYIVPKTTVIHNKPKNGLSSFEDYNDRGDVVALLESNGWKIVGQKGKKTIFLRPGQTTSQSSGNYDHEKKWFSVFTTSSDFEPQHAYQPYAVFAVLECNKDFSLASKNLYELGFGERFELPKEKEKAPSTRVIPSRINPEDEDYSFLAKPEDYNDYLQQVRDGTLPQGMTTGMPTLDKYFLFKEGELVMSNGHDGTGKSVVTWYLLLVAAMYHGWKSVVFSSENTLGGFMRKLIQFYWGKSLQGSYAMTDMEYRIAKEFIEKHFSIIKSEEDMFNYKDIINFIKKSLKLGQYKAALIDPYNSLKTDLSGYSKLSTHEYHYEALSDIKLFAKKTGLSIWINNHAVTAALRAKDGEKKYPVAPSKADTEGGGKFGNKADTFISIHRIVQHPTEWMVNEIHIRKVKDTETGGRPSPFDSPVKLEMYKGGCGFIEKLEDSYGVDPVEQWHLKNKPKQQEMTMPEPMPESATTNMWTPYKDNDDDDLPF